MSCILAWLEEGGAATRYVPWINRWAGREGHWGGRSSGGCRNLKCSTAIVHALPRTHSSAAAVKFRRTLHELNSLAPGSYRSCCGSRATPLKRLAPRQHLHATWNVFRWIGRPSVVVRALGLPGEYDWTVRVRRPHDLIMATLWNRAGDYIFGVWFLSSSFYSLPNLSRRRLDVYHTSTHGVALVRI